MLVSGELSHSTLDKYNELEGVDLVVVVVVKEIIKEGGFDNS